tara:strand:+ start:1085 stop:2848 length:1764 start_codon:yes stop_codon:yes gene_type:complete
MVKPSNQVKRLAAEKILSDLRDEGAKEKATILKGSQIKSNSFFATPSSLKPDTPEKDSGSTEFIADGFSTILTTLSGIAKSLNKSSKLDKKENEIDRRKDNKFRKRAREAELEQKKENKEKSGIGKKIAGVGKGLFGSLSGFFGKVLMGSSLLALLNYLKTGKGKFLAAGASIFAASIVAPLIPSIIGSILAVGGGAFAKSKIVSALAKPAGKRGLFGRAIQGMQRGFKVTGGKNGSRKSVKGFRGLFLRGKDKTGNLLKSLRRGVRKPGDLFQTLRQKELRTQRGTKITGDILDDINRPNMRTAGTNVKKIKRLSRFDILPPKGEIIGGRRGKSTVEALKKSGIGKGRIFGNFARGISNRLPGTNIKGLLPSGPPRLPGSGQLELILGAPRKIVKKFSSPQGRLTGTKIRGLLPPVKKVGFLKGIASKAKSIFKIGGKGGAKSLFKKIPIVGLGLGTMFAVQRLMAGDRTGAGMELLSGIAGSIPGLGTAASLSIDAALMAKDMGAFDKKDDTVTKTTNARKKNFEKLAKTRYSSTKVTIVPISDDSTSPAASSEGSQTEIPSSSSTSGVESNYTSSVYGLLGGSN